jgi:hypothetical protein
MTPVSEQMLTKDDEKRLRDLASGLIRGIEEPETVMSRCGFSPGDYTELCETRMFRQMLTEAQEEWEGARNTHKRIKLKAAVNIEEALPHFFQAMTDPKEPLSSKVKAFEVVSRVAGLGNPEPVAAGNGQFFKLEINLGGGVPSLVLQNGRVDDQIENVTIEHEALASGAAAYTRRSDVFTQSSLFDALPLEDL